MSEDPTVEMIKLLPVMETKKTRKRKIAAITYEKALLDVEKSYSTKQGEVQS